MNNLPQGEARSPDETSDPKPQPKRSPTTENVQRLGEVAPQSIANHELRASVPEELDRNYDPVVSAPASQDTARPLLKVEKEAASTLAGLHQVPIKPLTHPPAQHAPNTVNFRPLRSALDSSGRRPVHGSGSAQLQQASQVNELVYTGSQIVPDVQYLLPRVNEPRSKAGTVSTATQRLQQEQMETVKFSRARANASTTLAHVQVNRSNENRQAAPMPRDSRGQRTDLPHGQRLLPNYHTGLLVDPARPATALAASNAHRAQGLDRATQDYQAAVAALVGMRQGQPRPPAALTGPPMAVQHGFRQPFARGMNANLLGRPPHFAVPSYNHHQRYTTPHHLQRYALYQAQAGLRQYPTQAQVQLRIQMQRHYVEWLRRRGPDIARRTLPRPTINHGADRGGPYYTRLPTFFGAQFLARGRHGSNSTTSLPPKNTRTEESGVTDSIPDASTTSNAPHLAGPIHPLSDPKAQVDRMKQWETRYLDSYWTGHGRFSSDSEPDLWAHVVLPDVVLDPQDELGYEGNDGGQSEAEGEELAE